MSEYINEKHQSNCDRYKRIRDIVDGEYRLKTVDLEIANNGVQKTNKNRHKRGYLRQINPSDRSDYNVQRNRGYIEGAVLFNASSRTLSGLIGLIQRKDATWPEFAGVADYLVEDSDGAGLSLDHQSQLVCWNLIQVGRHGLLCDMPENANRSLTVSDVRNGMRPRILQYSAENIVDYNESMIDGRKELDLLVLREFVTEFEPNRIDRKRVCKYRVYRLVNGVVTVQMYDDAMSQEGEEIVVMAAGGIPFSRIPFVFVGSVNNNPDHDPMPLEPLVDCNLGHYQESANLRASSWETSAAQPYIADDKYFNYYSRVENEGKEIEAGSTSVHMLGTGGTYAFASPSPNSLSSDLMIKDEDRMVALGAQLVTSGGGAETAEAVRIKHGSDISVLESIVVNVADAYRKMFEYCYMFLGLPEDDFKVALNRDFFDASMTAQEITAVVQAWQSGAISEMEKSKRLQRGKVIDAETDLEEMHEAIQNEIAPAPQFDEVESSEATQVPTGE